MIMKFKAKDFQTENQTPLIIKPTIAKKHLIAKKTTIKSEELNPINEDIRTYKECLSIIEECLNSVSHSPKKYAHFRNAIQNLKNKFNYSLSVSALLEMVKSNNPKAKSQKVARMIKGSNLSFNQNNKIIKNPKSFYISEIEKTEYKRDKKFIYKEMSKSEYFSFNMLRQINTQQIDEQKFAFKSFRGKTDNFTKRTYKVFDSNENAQNLEGWVVHAIKDDDTLILKKDISASYVYNRERQKVRHDAPTSYLKTYKVLAI